MKITYDVMKFKKGQWLGIIKHHERLGEHLRPDSQLEREHWMTPQPMYTVRKLNMAMLQRANSLPGQKIPGQRTTRKDAVVMLGVHLQLGHSDLWRDASGKPLPPDQRPPLKQLAAHALKVAEEIYGAENIAGAVLHCDETAPHVEVYVVPMHNGKLNAKHFIDGPAALSKQWNQVYNNYRKAGFDVEAPDSGAGLGGAPLDGLAGKAGLLRTGSAIAENYILKRQLVRAQAEPERLTAIVKRHGKKLVALREENRELRVEKVGLIQQLSTAVAEGYDLAKAALAKLGAELTAALERIKGLDAKLTAAIERIKGLDEQVEALKREKAAAFAAGQQHERERMSGETARQVTNSDESQGLGL